MVFGNFEFVDETVISSDGVGILLRIFPVLVVPVGIIAVQLPDVIATNIPPPPQPHHPPPLLLDDAIGERNVK